MQNSWPKVSVAMCTFNGAKYILHQLRSILGQTYQPTEVVISDDGSTDETLNLVNQITEETSIAIKVINGNKTVGVAKNFDRAISNCCGEIIMISDQDDIWVRDKVEKIVNVFNEFPKCRYVFSDADLVDNNELPIKETLWERINFSNNRLKSFMFGDQVKDLLSGGNFTYGMTMAVRSEDRKLFLPILSESRELTHDVWIALVLSGLGYSGYALNECLVKYRQHSEQVVGAGSSKYSVISRIKIVLRPRWQTDFNLSNDLKLIADRISLISGKSPGQRAAIELILGKSNHVKSRQKVMRSNFIQRLNIVTEEVLSGRYHLYSSGIKSAIFDLIR